MLRPKRIHRRFNRRVTPFTRAVVRKQIPKEKFGARTGRTMRRLQRLRARLAGFRRVGLYLVLAGVVSALAAATMTVAFSSLFTVREIRVQRTDLRIDTERVQEALAPLFGQRIVLVTRQEALTLLRETIPDVESVTMQKRYPDALLLRLELDPVVARLDIREADGSAAKAASSGGQLPIDYLTAGGLHVLYTSAQVGTDVPMPTIEIADWGVRPAPWNPLLTPALLRTMQQAEVQLDQQFGLRTSKRRVYLRAQEFHLATQKHALWFDLRSPLQQQMDRYRIFLQAKGADAAREYVDLRITNKIVYK